MTTFEERIAEINKRRSEAIDNLFNELEARQVEWDQEITAAMLEYKPDNIIIRGLQQGKSMAQLIAEYSAEELKTAYDLSEAGGFTVTRNPRLGMHDCKLTEAGKRYPETVTTADGDAGSA